MSTTPTLGGGAFGSFATLRLVGPAVVADASGGQIQVNANTKFATNVPLDRFMLITKILYFLTWTKLPALGANANVGDWTIASQMTEALARTLFTASDGLFVDEWTLSIKEAQLTTSGSANPVILPGAIDRVLYNPWATQAQNLNSIVSVQPNNVNVNGPNVSVASVLEFQLLPITTDIRTYLATRVQIAGQA